MKTKRFLLFFSLTLMVNLGIAIIIGSNHGGVSSMLATIFQNPLLILPFIAASIIVGLSAAKSSAQSK